MGMVFVGLFLQIRRDLFAADVFAQVVIIDIGFHLHQVDDPFECVLAADGQLDGDRVTLQAVFHHFHRTVEIGAHRVHLIDIHHAGNMVFVGLMPDSLRLRLHASLGAQHRHTAVQNAKRAFHFHGEVHVARGVDDIDSMTIPRAGGSGGGNGDTSLLLLLHPVHGGGAIMGLTDLVVDACIIQDSFGGGGLTGIDMRHDADVTG